MTRRITLTIVGTVALTLLVAGAGTLLFSRLGARQQTEDELRSQSKEIVASIGDLTDSGSVRVIAAVRRSLHLEGLEVMRFGPGVIGELGSLLRDWVLSRSAPAA